MNIEDIRRNNLERFIQEKYKGKQMGFVDDTGVNQGELSGLINKKRAFGERKARKLEKLANLPTGWLDQDRSIGQAVVAVDGSSPPPNAIRIRHVKITVQAGVDGFDISQVDPEDEEEPEFINETTLIKNGWRADSLFNITVKGDSMEPGICAGDTVKVNTADTEPRDGRVYVLNFEGAVVIKRLFRDAGRWIIRSDNLDKTRHPDRTFTDRVFIIGRVVEKRSRRI